jgi:nucleoside triphosphate pyrophosphatase
MKRDFIYLASTSPRRRALLEQIGVEYRVEPAELAEQRLPGEGPAAYVLRLAEQKANAVWARVAAAERRAVLAADTAVVVGDEILGKPGDLEAALGMLARLSGRRHTVLTAVALRSGDTLATRLSTSEVEFREMAECERRAYCDTAEPFDKAGGYGIQGRGAVFIERIAGSYSGVMGLPLAETSSLLAPLGLPRWLAAFERAS